MDGESGPRGGRPVRLGRVGEPVGAGARLWPAEQDAVDVAGDPAVRRVEAYAGAIRALKYDARTERAVILAEEAEAHLDTLDQLEPAASAGLLFWIADCAVDPHKFEMAVDRAIDVLRTLPPSERLVDALIFRAGYLSFREEYAAALEVMREALATLEPMGPPRPLTRGVLATIADFEASTGDFEAALRTSASASALETPVPDPGRDAFTAMEHTVTLLTAGASRGRGGGGGVRCPAPSAALAVPGRGRRVHGWERRGGVAPRR